VLHVVQVAEMPALRRGAIDHMAFCGADIVATLTRLKARGIA
jgi:4-hydroxyphenylpyruvate dioxygenase-like putative hemolysin